MPQPPAVESNPDVPQLPKASSQARAASRSPRRSSGPDGVRGYYTTCASRRRLRSAARVLGAGGPPVGSRAPWGSAHTSATCGRGHQWLRNAVDVGEYALSQQVEGGPATACGSTGSPTRRPSSSRRMALGDGPGRGASLLTRLHLQPRTSATPPRPRARPRDSAPSRRAACRSSTGARGPRSTRPTRRPCLNGGIFALWGLYESARGSATRTRRTPFAQGADTLARNLHRWDTATGRAVLFPTRAERRKLLLPRAPHQLEAMNVIAPRPEFAAAASLRAVSQSRRKPQPGVRAQGDVQLAVPRNPYVEAHAAAPGVSDVLVLCYHAVSFALARGHSVPRRPSSASSPCSRGAAMSAPRSTRR